MDEKAQRLRMVVGSNIRALRKREGLSLRKCALMIGIDYTYLCEIEAGKSSATTDMLSKIATGLDVEPSDLLTANKFIQT